MAKKEQKRNSYCYGDVMPCNGMKDRRVIGNLNKQPWDELWSSSSTRLVKIVDTDVTAQMEE